MGALTCILALVAAIVLLSGGFLALFIGMILPREFFDPYYEIIIEKAPNKNVTEVKVPTSVPTQKVPDQIVTTRMSTTRKQQITTNEWFASVPKDVLYDVEPLSGFSINKPGNIEDYPFLVSLSLPLYLDVPDDYIFACTGAIVEKSLLLSGKTCLYHFSAKEVESVGRVRSNSNYFSTGGTEHEIIFINDTHKKFMLIKVQPEFNYPGIQIYLGNENEENEFVSLGWTNDWVSRIFYKSPFFVTKWYTTDHKLCLSSNNKTYGNWDEMLDTKLTLNGNPLVTATTKQLVGLEYNSDGQSKLKMFERYSYDMEEFIGLKKNYKISRNRENICRPAEMNEVIDMGINDYE